MDKLLLATVFTASLASAMPVAVAQTAPSQTMAPQVRQAEQSRHARRSSQLPSERLEGRLAQLQAALKITAAQKSLWENFAAVMRQHAREADRRFQERRTPMAGRSERQRLSAIERLERRQHMMAARARLLNELVAAGRPLYAAFTPEQKQVADGLLASRHGRGSHHRHRGMRPAA